LIETKMSSKMKMREKKLGDSKKLSLRTRISELCLLILEENNEKFRRK